MDQPDEIAALDRRFGIAGVAKVVAGQGGLAKVVVTTPAAEGEIYLHGAHVASWRPRGSDEVLFVSAQSRWEAGRAIRGGVPICFPWFANKADDPKAPAHGVVRTVAWELESIEATGDGATVNLVIGSSAATKPWSPGDFQLRYRATFGSELRLELTVKNTGPASFRFEEALHSYFHVGAIDAVRLEGLDQVRYVDKTDANRVKTQSGPLVIGTETDAVYLDSADSVELVDQSLRRRVTVAKENSRATVVWNPWVEKAKAMADFGDDEWRRMVCIETCNVAGCAVELAPGQQHTMTALVRVAAL